MSKRVTDSGPRATVGGRKVLAARRARGRKTLSPRASDRTFRSSRPNGMSPLTRRADFLAANRGRRAPMNASSCRPRSRRRGSKMRLGITVTKRLAARRPNRMKRRFARWRGELLPGHGLAGADLS